MDDMERSVECIFTGSDITESFVVKMAKSFEMKRYAMITHEEYIKGRGERVTKKLTLF